MTGTDAARTHSIASGLAWNTIFQIFNTAISFVAMLFMVRLLSAADYGLAAAAVAIISIANVIGAPAFVAHSLQLGEGETPDWTLHWNVSLPLQLALFLLLNLVALLCSRIPAYAPIAGLLQVGSLGVLLESPAQIAAYTLRRNLDFRRLRIIQGASGLINATAMVAIASAGGGAYALIIANNVLPALLLSMDLLLVRRWRPHRAWWTPPELQAYAAAGRFGAQSIASGLLARSRAFAEGVFLPMAAGFSAIGVMNRASALHGLTVLRVEGILMETAYPLLPRAASDPVRYARVSMTYAQIVILTATCGSIAVGLLGVPLSRVLYGARWAAADPFIWPAALLGLGITISSVGVNVLMAAGRLRATVLLNALGAGLGLPIIIVAVAAGSLVPYMWALAAAQMATAAVSMATASAHFGAGWKRELVLPPAVIAGCAAAVALVLTRALDGVPYPVAMAAQAVVYVITAILVTRVFFPVIGARVLDRLPGSRRTIELFRLQRWSGT
jgi:O-antigen/teichoic acid export membrane protein